MSNIPTYMALSGYTRHAHAAEHRNNLAFYARAAAIVVLLSILAGLALRLFGYVGSAYSWFLFSSASDDSWMPMGLAYARVIGQHAGSLHDLFFVDHVKFQYPASSLLLYSAVDFLGISPTPRAMNTLVWLSILTLPYPIFRLCVLYIDKYRRTLGFSPFDKYLVAASFAFATLFFYPIMICWRLGQVQAFINLLFAFACLWWLTDRKVGSGALIGLACLIKPQFSLFFIWALLRGEKKFAWSQLAVIGVGSLLSLTLYGWHNNIFYIDILSYISRHGETFWDNSSVNGFFNRLVNPHETLIFKYNEFPHFNYGVYVATVMSSAIIVAFALFGNRTSPARGSALDFTTAGLSFTLASPIAWGHHYGIALPVLAITFLEIIRQTEGTERRTLFIIWAACFLLFSNDWNVTEQLAETYFSFLQSWRLFAAQALLWMMYRLQYLSAEPARDEVYARTPLWNAR